MRRRGSASASSRDAGSIHSRAIPASTTLAGQPSVSASRRRTNSWSCCLSGPQEQHLSDLGRVEQQEVSRDARDLAAEAQLLEPEGRLVSREDDEVDGLGAVLEQVPEHLVHARRIHGLVVVVEDDVAVGLDEPIALGAELGGQHVGRDVEHRSGLELAKKGRAEARVQSAHGSGHGREEGQRVVIEDVELVPDRRPAAVLEGGGCRGGLAVAGRGADDGEPAVERGCERGTRVGSHADVVEAWP